MARGPCHRLRLPAAANRAGIVCIFQELSLILDLSVADNILISDPPTRMGLIDRRAQRRLVEAALARAGGEDIHPAAQVKDLPLSRRQVVEIAKALARRPRILIRRGHPALTAADVTKVFAVLKRLRAEGLASLLISHRMHEIAGSPTSAPCSGTAATSATFSFGSRSAEIVEMMIGRSYSHVFRPSRQACRKRRRCSKPGASPGPTASRTSRSRSGRARWWAWAGSTARASASPAGPVRRAQGREGRDPDPWPACAHHRPARGPLRARAHGPDPRGPQDRGADAAHVGKRELPSPPSAGWPFGIVDRDKEAQAIARMVQLLSIRSDGVEVPVGSLSGGNQQKVVIANG
ncbi:MAG: hypothetical protein U1E17_04200 [Geminicoccaceae bacterium]